LLDRGGRLDPGRFVVSGCRSRLDLGTCNVFLGYDLVYLAAESIGDLLECFGPRVALAVLDPAERGPADSRQGSEAIEAVP
jgi:hypothetical protein